MGRPGGASLDSRRGADGGAGGRWRHHSRRCSGGYDINTKGRSVLPVDIPSLDPSVLPVFFVGVVSTVSAEESVFRGDRHALLGGTGFATASKAATVGVLSDAPRATTGGSSSSWN